MNYFTLTAPRSSPAPPKGFRDYQSGYQPVVHPEIILPDSKEEYPSSPYQRYEHPQTQYPEMPMQYPRN